MNDTLYDLTLRGLELIAVLLIVGDTIILAIYLTLYDIHKELHKRKDDE